MTGALNWAVDEIGAAFGVLDDHWWSTQAARSAAETLPIPGRRFHRGFAPKQCCSSAEVGRELVAKLVRGSGIRRVRVGSRGKARRHC